MYARRLGKIAIEQYAGVADDTDRAAQIVCGLAPALRALLLEQLQLVHGLLQIAQPRRRFRLLQTQITRAAFDQTVAAHARQCPPCHRHDALGELRPAGAELLELIEQAQLQVSPFAHGLALVVTLLPAMQAVFGGTHVLQCRRLPSSGVSAMRRRCSKPCSTAGIWSLN